MIDRRRKQSGWLAVQLAPILVVLALPSVAQAPADPAERQFDALRGVMLDWTRGEAPTQNEVAAVFVADADPRPRRVTSCIAKVEEDLTEHLGETPAFRLPLAFWQIRMLFGAMQWSESDEVREADIDRVVDRLKAYHDKAARSDPSLTQEEVDRHMVLAWTGVGELFARHGKTELYLRAEQALDRALEIDRHFVPARYLKAWVGEKVHDPLDLMRPWRELAQDVPERPEFRLRFAMAARRAARTDAALEALEAVAHSDGAEWMRVLAYEEWVQTLLEGGDGERAKAREILAQARRQLPGRPDLDLLASHLLLSQDRRQALRLAERIEAHDWGAEELSPRLVYEVPQESEVGPARAELIAILRERWQEMAAYLQALEADDVLKRKSRSACER